MNAETTFELRALPAAKRRKRRLQFLLPIVAFAGLVLTLAWALNHNPREIPSALIGSPVPPFKGRTAGLSNTDLVGEVSLVNVFASWCVACREESRFTASITRTAPTTRRSSSIPSAIPTRTGADTNGRVAIDWGVYGVLETFVITKDGRIAYKHIGPLMPHDLESAILPLIMELHQL